MAHEAPAEWLPTAQLCRSYMQFGSERSGFTLTRELEYIPGFISRQWKDSVLTSGQTMGLFSVEWQLAETLFQGSRCAHGFTGVSLQSCCFWVRSEAEHPGGEPMAEQSSHVGGSGGQLVSRSWEKRRKDKATWFLQISPTVKFPSLPNNAIN